MLLNDTELITIMEYTQNRLACMTSAGENYYMWFE